MKNKIRKFRKEKGLSQKELADAIGVSFQSISFFERGDKNPSIENWIKLANFFNVSVPELQGYEEKNVSIKKMNTLIQEKPNDDYTKSLVAENIRQFKLLDKKQKNKLIEQLNNSIANNQSIDLMLLINLSDVFTRSLNSKDENEIYTKLQTFLKMLLGYIENKKDRTENDVTESFQTLLSAINKNNS